jgi:quinol monooxygenase YgiN
LYYTRHDSELFYSIPLRDAKSRSNFVLNYRSVRAGLPKNSDGPDPDIVLEETPMVLEIASIEVQPELTEQFEKNVGKAIPIFLRARGCRGVELHRTIEHPGRYLLMVQWETVEDHTVLFRQSDDFQEWRRLVGPYFLQTPVVVHTEIAVRGRDA